MAIDGGGSLSIITKAVGQPVAHSAQRAAAQRAAPEPPAGGRPLPATGRRHHPTRCPTTHLKKNGGGVHASGAFAAQAHRAPPPSKPWVARKTSRVQPPPAGWQTRICFLCPNGIGAAQIVNYPSSPCQNGKGIPCHPSNVCLCRKIL